MESVEREMERAAFICLRTSHYLEKPFSRDKPSSPFRVPSHPGPYCHHHSHPGISLFPLLKMRFMDSKTYPYLRLILDLFGMVGCVRDDITHFQEVRSEAKGVGSSMDRCHLPCSPLSHLLDRAFINWNSEPTLSLPLVTMGTFGLGHGLDFFKIL